MNTFSFQLKLRGHTYIGVKQSNRDQLTQTLADWCNNPELDFEFEDSQQMLKEWREVPDIFNTICGWRH